MSREDKDNIIIPKVGRNMVLNVMKTLMSIVFPLITYPYATRILGVDNFGKVNYGQSIISYIALIAALGISTYAIREGGIYRNNKDKLAQFGSEIFSINILTTIVAYIALFILVLASKNMQSIALLLAIQSLSILFTTIAIDWMNVIFEDYLYITVRSFIVQLAVLIALFVFVKTPDDYYEYAALQVVASAVIAILNWTHLNKKCRLKVTRDFKLKKHIKPILVLFSNSVAVSIYLNSDNVMLGWMIGDYYVGLYSVAVKIYTILKQLVGAIYSVVITRLTEYIAEDRNEDYRNLLTSVISNLFLVAVPVSIGLFCVSKSITFFIAGNDYLGGVIALQVLAITIPFAVLGGALAYCVNLPLKREKYNLIATSISAVENILLNIWMIPKYNIFGVAVTTFLAEVTVCLIIMFTLRNDRHLFDVRKIGVSLVKSLISGIPIVPIVLFLSKWISYSSIWFLVLSVLFSGAAYICANLLLKNEPAQIIMGSFVAKLKR